MFNQLLESKAKKPKMAGATIITTILYGGLIVLAVYATADAGIKNDRTKAETIKFVEVKKAPPPEEKKPPPPKEVVIKPPPLYGGKGSSGSGCP